jgi:hypothetical protein
MGNMCANERQKQIKDFDPHGEKMKKRVRAMRRALAQALLEGENEGIRKRDNERYISETRDSILKMSAGTTEDHFSRDSEEIRGKRRQKKLAVNEYNVDPDLSVKEDDGDENEDDKGTFMNPNSYDARMAYNIQPDSPRRTVRVFEPNVNHNVGNKSERPNNRRVSWGGQETKIIDDDVDYAIDNYDDALPPPETVDV